MNQPQSFFPTEMCPHLLLFSTIILQWNHVFIIHLPFSSYAFTCLSPRLGLLVFPLMLLTCQSPHAHLTVIPTFLQTHHEDAIESHNRMNEAVKRYVSHSPSGHPSSKSLRKCPSSFRHPPSHTKSGKAQKIHQEPHVASRASVSAPLHEGTINIQHSPFQPAPIPEAVDASVADTAAQSTITTPQQLPSPPI